MNNIRYYPAIFYTAILMAVWLLSWLLGIYEIVADDVNGVNSLISAEGLRWALRTAQASIASAPWAVAMLAVVSWSFIVGSGFWNSLAELLRLNRLSANRRKAFIMAVITLLVFVVVLAFAVFSPMRILQGVTSDIQFSPLTKGWALLMLVISILISVVYATMCGVYRSFNDMMQSVCKGVSAFVPALIAFVPASGILPCLQYVGFITDTSLLFFYEWVLYVLPFICVVADKNKRN